jgi:methylated-DNA-protein-cysteine methyltransferase-like protein
VPKAKPNPKAEQDAAKIRQAIMSVPRGKVSTYGAIAEAAGFPRGARLVVRVLRHSHGLPWQRIVAAGGRIATCGEDALDQRFRLEMEGVKFSGRKVRMAEFEFKFPKKRTRKKTRVAKKIPAHRSRGPAAK